MVSAWGAGFFSRVLLNIPTDGPFCFSAVRSRIGAESQLQALALGSLTDIAFSLLSTGSRRQAEMGDGDGCAGHAGPSRRVRWQLGQWARELGVQSVLWVVEFRTSRYAVSSNVLAEFFFGRDACGEN